MFRTDSLLAPILKSLGIEESVRLARIKNNWHHIFKKPLVSHMFPAKLSEAELLINVDSPIWMQQLSFCKKEILGKLNAYGIRDVRFRVGKVLQKKQTVRPRLKKPGLSEEEALFMSEVLSGISDENLKASVKKALEKSLSSGKLSS